LLEIAEKMTKLKSKWRINPPESPAYVEAHGVEPEERTQGEIVHDVGWKSIFNFCPLKKFNSPTKDDTDVVVASFAKGVDRCETDESNG